MNEPIEQVTLEQALDAYVEDSPEPSLEKLKEWIKRYPQFERELTEFIVAWIQTEHLPSKNRQEDNAISWVSIGMDIAKRAYLQQSVQNPSPLTPHKAPFVSIFSEGEINGHSPEDLARKLNISVTLIHKLERRLLQPESIPLNLTEFLAKEIRRDPVDISSYLVKEAYVPRGLQLKSKRAAKLSPKQNFFDAVRSDNTLSEDQRAFWLSFEPKTD